MPRHVIHDGEATRHVDLCQRCWPPEADTLQKITSLSPEVCAKSVEEDSELGSDHPDYTAEQKCEDCGHALTSQDN